MGKEAEELSKMGGETESGRERESGWQRKGDKEVCDQARDKEADSGNHNEKSVTDWGMEGRRETVKE